MITLRLHSPDTLTDSILCVTTAPSLWGILRIAQTKRGNNEYTARGMRVVFFIIHPQHCSRSDLPALVCFNMIPTKGTEQPAAAYICSSSAGQQGSKAPLLSSASYLGDLYLFLLPPKDSQNSTIQVASGESQYSATSSVPFWLSKEERTRRCTQRTRGQKAGLALLCVQKSRALMQQGETVLAWAAGECGVELRSEAGAD